MPKPWSNSRNKYSLVCVDIFSKMADMEPLKDKEADTCTNAMENIFKRLGVPETIYIVMKVVNLLIKKFFKC
jgi:hypothetical protein